MSNKKENEVMTKEEVKALEMELVAKYGDNWDELRKHLATELPWGKIKIHIDTNAIRNVGDAIEILFADAYYPVCDADGMHFTVSGSELYFIFDYLVDNWITTYLDGDDFYVKCA